MSTITLKAWEKQGRYQLKEWIGCKKTTRQTTSSRTVVPKTCVVDANTNNVTVKAVFKLYEPYTPRDQGP